MATAYKVLGQNYPSAATLTTLYTTPSATKAVISSFVITNLSSTADNFRIAIRVAGASIDAKQYLFYDAPIKASESIFATLGITISATDVISVYSTNGTIAFIAYGSEIS